MEAIRRTVIWTGIAGSVLGVLILLGANAAFGQATPAPKAPPTMAHALEYMSLAFAAAISGGLGLIGGGYAVGQVGAAAIGAASERPEMLVRSLVFVAIGEGIAIFGLVLAIMMLTKLGNL